jgi:hypothetical protein
MISVGHAHSPQSSFGVPKKARGMVADFTRGALPTRLNDRCGHGGGYTLLRTTPTTTPRTRAFLT